MAKPRRTAVVFPLPGAPLPGAPLIDAGIRSRPRATVPHEFVLDALSVLSPYTRKMFGCLAVYVGERIVAILRDKPTHAYDNGVWLATTQEHHESLRTEFPNMRSIRVLGKDVTGWQILPVEAPDFEESALHACELICAGDPRIGKVPARRKSKKRSAAKEQSPPRRRSRRA